MKNKIIPVVLLGFVFNCQSSIYNIQVEPLEGTSINLSAYANKKILVTSINAANPSVSQLLWLDSLQNAHTSLKIIAVSSKDGGEVTNDAALVALKTGLSLDFIITKPAHVKRIAGSSQHPLFKWLTQVNENGHFDRDVDANGQLFIVNKNGKLYSVLDDDVPAVVLSQVLNQEEN